MNKVKASVMWKGRGARWSFVVVVWAAVGIVGLNTYAMELGAVHHDIFCRDH
jgi:hypothetical protein